MINLKDFDRNTQLDLVRGCESFFMTYRSPVWQKPIVRKLMDEFGKKYEIPIKVILTAASKAVRYGMSGSQFPLDFMKFKKAEANTKKNIPYKETKRLLALMEDNGYLTVYLGHNTGDKGITTCIRFHDKLLKDLDKKKCDKWGLSRMDGFKPLEVVDSINSTPKKKTFHSLKKFKGVKEKVDNVLLVNKEIEKHLITYKGETCAVAYKIRYEDDLQSGGRWYVVGTFQVESSEGRSTIKIDSLPTVEVDIDCIHPSIAASMIGMKLPEDYDPYDITSYVTTAIETKTLRSFVKPCFMALLYSNNRSNALHEIRKKLWDNKHIGNWLDAETILESLEEHNYLLSSFFYQKDNWKFFQFIDSQIATLVMTHFASKGEVCLGYHDSFIVIYHNKEELIQVMTESWKKVVGTLDNFKCSVEFDNTPEQKHLHPTQENIPIEAYYCNL